MNTVSSKNLTTTQASFGHSRGAFMSKAMTRSMEKAFPQAPGEHPSFVLKRIIDMLEKQSPGAGKKFTGFLEENLLPDAKKLIRAGLKTVNNILKRNK